MIATIARSIPCTWLLGVLVLGACKEPEPQVDPIDDPWIDAIDTGEVEPVVAADPAVVPSETPSIEPSAPAPLDGPQVAEAATPEGQPAVGVLMSPSQPSSKPTASKDTPVATPTEQVVAEAPVAAEQAVEQPAVVEPTPAPEPAKPAAPPPITVADFHGNYRFSGGSTQRDELTAAIETSILALNSALHGIARKRITAANPVDNTVDITVAGNKITTRFESGFSVTCEIDGGATATKGIGGEKLDVRVRVKGSKIVQHLQGRDGARTIVYTLSSDRKTLTVHHKITADRLPVPVTYRLSYSRK